MKRLRNNRGMTLTEVIVAMALVCIGALIITMAVAASQTLIRRGVDTGTAAQEALSEVEQSGGGTAGAVRLRIGNAWYTVEGTYMVGGESDVTAAAFQPDLHLLDSGPADESEEIMP